MNEQIQLVRRYLRGAWPYRWLALACSILVCLGGWTYALYIPNTYQVNAKIFIDTNSMLRPLLRGLAISNNSLSNTATLMKRTLLTRPSLEEVARKTDLDLQAKTPQEFDEIVTGLSKRISLSGTERDNIYVISFNDSDPNKAKRVVDELLNNFLETALGSSRKDTAVTQKFLDEQIAEYEKRLIDAEERLKEFKQRNAGIMPGDGGGYYGQLTAAKSQLAQAELELKEAQNRKTELRRQLEGEDPVFGMMESSPWGMGSPATQYDARIASLEGQLDQLLLQYTDKHPDIVGIRGTIESLKAKRDEELANAAATMDTGPAMYGSPNESPVYRGIKMTLASAEAEVAGLSARVEEYRKRVDELEKRIDTIPEIEAELKRLDRDYGLNRSQYTELLKRRESARLSQEVDQSADDIKLKVIEPPRIPLSPKGPDRLMFLAMAYAAALGVGAVVAFLMSQINPNFNSAVELREFTQLPVLGSISLISSRRQKTERRMELAVFSVGLLGLTAVFLTLVALQSTGVDLHSRVAGLVGQLI